MAGNQEIQVTVSVHVHGANVVRPLVRTDDLLREVRLAVILVPGRRSRRLVRPEQIRGARVDSYNTPVC